MQIFILISYNYGYTRGGMSFDMFNYVPTVHEIDRCVGILHERIHTLTRRRLDLASLTGPAKTLMASDDARLTARIIDDNRSIDALDEMKKKIRALVDLPSQVKSQLYSIYHALGVKLEDFALRLPICYEGVLMEIAPRIISYDREKIRDIYRKYELLPLPKYYRWICVEGTI